MSDAELWTQLTNAEAVAIELLNIHGPLSDKARAAVNYAVQLQEAMDLRMTRRIAEAEIDPKEREALRAS